MTQNYKRIAKNTLFLYFRMIIIMAVSLYTTRIVLSTLGITDFGIYSVVASFVLMFSFLEAALTSATQRFITFELGKVGKQELQKVFSISMIIHIGLAFGVALLAELIGLWFLHNKLNIPVDRMDAAFWVFQFAVISTMVNIIKVPYHAMVIAHEKMNFFAYMSILEAILKLLAVYLLVIITFDKLVAYAGFVSFIVMIVLGFYYIYNKQHYNVESTFTLTWDNVLAKEMLSFSGWSLFGGIAWMLMNHGINIMLNIFFGPAVNAARGISMQVNIALASLINSFRMAVNPQIIKMYSGKNNDGMIYLSFLSARYTFYLTLLLVLPLFLEMEKILSIWLLEVPMWTIEMVNLVFILILITNIDLSFGSVFQALGNIKMNQIFSGTIYLTVLPVSSLLTYIYKLEPTAVFYIQIIAAMINVFIFKVYLLNKIADVSYSYYLENFLYPLLKVFIFILFGLFITNYVELNFLMSIIFTTTLLISAVFIFEFNKSQKIKVKKIIINKLFKR